MIHVLLEILNLSHQARQVLLPSNAREDSVAAQQIVLVKTKYLIIYIYSNIITITIISFVETRASFSKEPIIFKLPTEKIFRKIRLLIQIFETDSYGVTIRIMTKIQISLGRRGNGLIEKSLARTTKFSEYITRINQLHIFNNVTTSKAIIPFSSLM